MKLVFQAIISVVLFGSTMPLSTAAVVNEFTPNPAGLDPEQQFIELSGMAGTDFSGFVLTIGGEVGRTGTVDSAQFISGQFDSNGLLLVTIPDFLNPTFTIALASGFTGTVGETDLDLNDDGIADNLISVTGIEDALGVANSSFGEQFLYGDQLGGQDFSYTGDDPRLVFRDGMSGEWYAINDPANGSVFTIDGEDISSSAMFNGNPFASTFGASNPFVTAVPEPGSVAVLTLAVLGCATRRWCTSKFRNNRRLKCAIEA